MPFPRMNVPPILTVRKLGFAHMGKCGVCGEIGRHGVFDQDLFNLAEHVDPPPWGLVCAACFQVLIVAEIEIRAAHSKHNEAAA